MDNLTHTLCGLALARAGGDRLGRHATAVIVVAANLPDIDVVGWSLGGQPWYLCNHRGITHAALGLALLAPIVAAVAAATGRLLRPDEPARFGSLVLAAALGLASHLLLDGLNTYGVRPWLPFVETWYHGDVAFIVDPWLWLCFGLAARLGAPPPAPGPSTEEPMVTAAEAALAEGERLAALGKREQATDVVIDALARLDDPRRRERDAARARHAFDAASERWTWWGLTLVAAAVLAFVTRRNEGSPLVAAAFLAAATTVHVVRARGVPSAPARRRQAAWLGLGLAAVYLVVLGGLGSVARARARAEVARLDPEPLDHDASCAPAPGVPWRFNATVGNARRLHRVKVDLLRGAVERTTVLPRHLADPLRERARLDHAHRAAPDVVRAWRVFARQPFVAEDEHGHLVLGDGRYELAPKRAWCNLVVESPAEPPPD